MLSLIVYTPPFRIITKTQSRNQILKSLAHSVWDKGKGTLLPTYKVIRRPVMNYTASIWSPGRSRTHVRTTCQNSSLRTNTRSLLMTPIEHLHSEALKFPVKEHNVLLSNQFPLGCFRRNPNPTHRRIRARVAP